MQRTEIYDELKLPYDDLCKYLIKKYGGAVCDYFYTTECKTKSKKISRTKEGLYCHHWDEDKGGNLASPTSAKTQPFEWQKKERLIYCNILEHLILHIKIAILRQKGKLKKPSDIYAFFTTGGIFMICADINNMFSGIGIKVPWIKRCFDEIADNYNEYILLLQTILQYIDLNYIGKRDEKIKLEIGTILTRKRFSSTLHDEIIYVSENKREFTIKCEDGTEHTLHRVNIENILTSEDYFDIIMRELSFATNHLYEQVYNDIQKYKENTETHNIANILEIDYDEYGFYQYEDILLGYCKILATSDIYNQKNGQYCSKFSDELGVHDATVLLSLGREDFQLFQEKYDIRYMKILDGCCFV